MLRARLPRYQRLQLELERQPTDFFTRRAYTGFWGERTTGRASSRGRVLPLRGSLGARTQDLVFAPNATSGLNAVIRSLALRRRSDIRLAYDRHANNVLAKAIISHGVSDSP